jgi:hypothetical protein
VKKEAAVSLGTIMASHELNDITSQERVVFLVIIFMPSDLTLFVVV